MALHDEVVKRVLSREFGIEGVDDPNELRAILAEKEASLSPADLLVLTMQLGQELKELQAGGPPKIWARLTALAIIGIIAWLIWRPLIVILLIFSVAGWVRSVAIQHSLFWGAPRILIVGLTYGLVIAGIVAIATNVLLTNTVAIIVFRTFGLMASSYVGYGAPSGPFASPGDDKRSQTASIAALVYLVVTALLWLILR